VQIAGGGVVVSDCRYVNEHEAGKALASRLDAGYSLWWVENPDVQPQGEEAEKTAPLRVLADVIIHNGQGITLDGIHAQARAAFNRLSLEIA